MPKHTDDTCRLSLSCTSMTFAVLQPIRKDPLIPPKMASTALTWHLLPFTANEAILYNQIWLFENILKNGNPYLYIMHNTKS